MPTPRQPIRGPAVEHVPNMTSTSYFWDRHSITPLPVLPAHLRHTLYSLVTVRDPIDAVKRWQDTNPADAPAACLDNFPITLESPFALRSRVGAGIEASSVHRKSMLEGGKTNRVLLLNAANHIKPGGESQGRPRTQEEDYARRTNLVQCLESTDPQSGMMSYYPLEGACGIYSPNVVIYKDGYDERYVTRPRENWTAVSVVSVSPTRNPRLNGSGEYYSSEEDMALQYEKMEAVLRIAALNGHVNIALTGFGNIDTHPDSRSTYRNPIVDVARMWKKLLLEEDEFKGWFEAVQFIFNGRGGWRNDPSDSEVAREEYGKYFGTQCGNVRIHEW